MSKKQPKRDSTNKLFLIYMFEFYEEDHMKIFDAILHEKLDFPYKFHNHSQEENAKMLSQWRRINNIRLCEYEVIKKPAFKDGVPIYIKRISGEPKKQLNFMGEDVRE